MTSYISDKTIKVLKTSLADMDKRRNLVLILKTLSDPTRFNIYLLLHKVEEIPVTDICQVFDLNPPTAFYALSDFKKLGLVESSQCGELVYYSLKKQSKNVALVIFFLKNFSYKEVCETI